MYLVFVLDKESGGCRHFSWIVLLSNEQSFITCFWEFFSGQGLPGRTWYPNGLTEYELATHRYDVPVVILVQ